MCRFETRRAVEQKSRRAGEVRSHYSILLLFCSTALLLFGTGCTQEMANQPRFDAMEPVPGLPEGLAALGPVIGTVARGELVLDDPYFTGKADGQPVGEIPTVALEDEDLTSLLERGQQRFVVMCSHCHGQLGGGTGGGEAMEKFVGMVVQRGFPAPPTFHQQRLRDAPIGHFFDVITNGFGRMPPHGYLVPVQDRWAISAYIRALQLSQNAPRDELEPRDLEQLEVETKPGASAPRLMQSAGTR
jgi:mono/diheme cytochrome c family protein